MLRLLLAALLLCLPGCGAGESGPPPPAPPADPPAVLRDLSWEGNPRHDARVFLRENGELTPYLVLTEDYGGTGCCLLLREQLLPERMAYTHGSRLPAYYAGSAIDGFLNGDFLSALAVRDQVPAVPIDITAPSSLGVGGRETLTISRRVFLLSFTEVKETLSRTNLKEGEHLPFFANAESRIACRSEGSLPGTPDSWWLRTANTTSVSLVCSVGVQGEVNIAGIWDPAAEDGERNGIRPALCLPARTPVCLTQQTDGPVYTLAP